jgi:hypothetical protein
VSRLDHTDQFQLDATIGWLGLFRFCLGLVSLGAPIYLGCVVYLYSILRDFGDNAKILGVRVPYSIMIPLLAVLCLLSAFVAVYVFFFPTQSSTET